MFNQLVFLLYTVSAISGIVAFVYFTTAFLFSRQSLFRDYLFFLLSYSLMVVTATISVYLKVNSGENVVALHIFNVGMITGCHLLAFTLPRFVHIAVKNVFPRPWKSFFLIIFFSLPLFLCLFFLIPAVSVYILWISFLLFFISIVYSLFHAVRVFKKETSQAFKVGISAFMVFCLSLAFCEIFFFRHIKSLHGFTLSLPVNYLIWNTLSIVFDIGGFHLLTISIVPDATQIRKYHLTKQEVCILEYILKGKSNKEIAAALFISSHTVKNHIYNLFQKTSVGSRYELISRFREQK